MVDFKKLLQVFLKFSSFLTMNVKHKKNKAANYNNIGWAWWLMLVIRELWEAEAGESPEVRSSSPAWLIQ